MEPREQGRFMARPKKWSVARTGPNKLPTFWCNFDVISQFDDDGETHDLDCGTEISGYFYLIQKNGQPNAGTIERLRDVLGWDGISFAALNDTDWSDVDLQVTLVYEEWQGKTRLKIKYLNPADWVPQTLESDPETLSELDREFGAKLREVAGDYQPASAKPPAARTRKPAAAPQRDDDIPF